MQIKSFSNNHEEIKIISGKYLSDSRGTFKKTIFGENLKNLMPNPSEVLSSTSKKNVIRGLHFQNPPHEVSKFITCLHGEINDVFLDIRKTSERYGEHGSIKLNGDDNLAVFIPEGYAHGFSVLSEYAVVVYLQSKDFDEKHDESINPLSLDIDWMVENPIISEKDLGAVNFVDFDSLF
tara:strand:+ start:171 stop:707 length:537 start_codon:yes stop_codon:yes gene_type:complete